MERHLINIHFIASIILHQRLQGFLFYDDTSIGSSWHGHNEGRCPSQENPEIVEMKICDWELQFWLLQFRLHELCEISIAIAGIIQLIVNIN